MGPTLLHRRQHDAADERRYHSLRFVCPVFVLISDFFENRIFIVSINIIYHDQIENQYQYQFQNHYHHSIKSIYQIKYQSFIIIPVIYL